MMTLPLATVKSTLSSIVDQIERTHQRVTITRNGKPAAVVLSVEDLESLEETLSLMSDPQAMERLAQAEVAGGDTVGEAELRAMVARRNR